MANTIKDALEELPPRARRIRGFFTDKPVDFGTTSACAENTPWCRTPCTGAGNYLRVRGEYVGVRVYYGS